MKPSAAAAAVTAALALVGVARRLDEQRRTRRRLAARLGPATTVLPRSRPGPIARRFAAWTPAPARTRWGHAAGAAWAAPLTVTGGLLAAAGRADCRWDPRNGCWVATGVGGPSGRMLAALGFDGNAIGQVVLCRSRRPSPALLAHESVHVRQAERLGVVLPLAYAWFSARYGYRDNPLERAARKGAAAAG